jgi:hypothetical protein
MNGELIIKIKTERFQLNILDNKREIPVTPPSNNRLGTRKHSKPILAQKTPIVIKIVSFDIFPILVLILIIFITKYLLINQDNKNKYKDYSIS